MPWAAGATRTAGAGGFIGHAAIGRVVSGAQELKSILKAHGPEFTRCLTEKMLTYALGRGLEEYDHCAVDQIVKNVDGGRYRFSALVLAIVKSDPFQKRRTHE